METTHTNLTFTVLAIPPLQANCTLVIDSDSGRGMVFDPGGDAEGIYKTFKEKGGKELTAIYCTHGHADHILEVGALKELSGADVYFPTGDMDLWNALSLQCLQFGIEIPPNFRELTPDVLIDESHTTVIGDGQVIHTPGHSPGSVCFYFASSGVLIAGDLLFYRSIGRTDLPGGNMDDILRSIREKVFVLDSQTRVITGHGPATNIADEIAENPFLN